MLIARIGAKGYQQSVRPFADDGFPAGDLGRHRRRDVSALSKDIAPRRLKTKQVAKVSQSVFRNWIGCGAESRSEIGATAVRLFRRLRDVVHSRRKRNQRLCPTTGCTMAERSPISDVEARFNSIVAEHGARLRRAIVRLCPKDLGIQFDDVEQEARLRLWRLIESEREIRDLSSYIYRIAVTTVIDATRQAKARREEQFRSTEEQTEDNQPHSPPTEMRSRMPDRIVERQLVIEKVEQILSTFQDDRRRAVGLYLQGMTTNEIAGLMMWTEPKARNLVYRGLADLREQLRSAGIEYEID